MKLSLFPPLRRGLTLLLAAALLLTPALAGDAPTPQMEETAQALLAAVPKPQVGSIGGEWAILGLARSGCPVPEGYFQDYLARLEEELAANHGSLHQSKYTEYSRVILAVTALGQDARQVGGYDLTLPLGDYDKTVWQGINGPIWALLALDSAGYPMPQHPTAQTQATRQAYVDYLLDHQLADGGWSLSGAGIADPDVTAMVLQALAKYQDQPAVAKVTQEALDCLSLLQEEDGGYSSWGSVSSESVAQVLVALAELDILPTDPRFVKEGNSPLDNLLAHRQKDGSFRHSGEGTNLMATEQAFYALTALWRRETGRPSLYSMEDALPAAGGAGTPAGTGLPGKHEAVTPRPVTQPDKSFSDLSSSPYAEDILALAQREIISGKPGGLFDPQAPMTRSEFAAIVVNALGLPAGGSALFTDVPANAWYAQAVSTAYSYGVVTGVGDLTFQPLGTITRQEAAVMAARAAALCGLDAQVDPASARDVLSLFPDYTTSAQWARPALAFCYREELLDPEAENILPLTPITRGEIARLLFRLLDAANLL